jgi:hypothetical protein
MVKKDELFGPPAVSVRLGVTSGTYTHGKGWQYDGIGKCGAQ